MLLPDGFHRLDILLLDKTQNIKLHETVYMASGTQALQFTILDQRHQPVENASVHLELVAYSHIALDYNTNHAGQVTFHHLPKYTQVYVEAVCMKSKRLAFAEIDTVHYHNLTLVLQDLSILDYNEYESLDRGYYAV